VSDPLADASQQAKDGTESSNGGSAQINQTDPLPTTARMDEITIINHENPTFSRRYDAL